MNYTSGKASNAGQLLKSNYRVNFSKKVAAVSRFDPSGSRQSDFTRRLVILILKFEYKFLEEKKLANLSD